MKKRSMYIGLICLTLFLPLFGTDRASAVDSSLQDIIDAGELHVGLEAGYPPFEMVNATTTEYTGFDIDIIEYIMNEIDPNITVIYHDVAWAAILAGLALGDYDVICSAMTITPEREAEADFTRWYYKSTQAVMVTMDNPKKISTVEDINSTDVTVGFQSVTTSEWYLTDEEAPVIATLNGYETITLAIQALNTGAVDVVVGDYAPLKSGQNANPGEFAIIDTFSPEDFGIACQTGADTLRLAINAELDLLLGTNITDPVWSTEYTNIYKEWFFGATPTTEFLLDPVPEGGIQIPGFTMVSLIAAVTIASMMLIRKNKK
jgi:polar amino acid transport system substrate-binding protein